MKTPVALPLIAGMSHLHAFGLTAFGGELGELPLASPRFVGLSGAWPRNEEYWDEAIRVSGNRDLGLVWSGNQYNWFFLLLSEPEFDFDVPEHVSARYWVRDRLPDQSKALIAFKRVCAVYEQHLSQLDALISKIEKGTGKKPFLIATPPPRGDEMLQREFETKTNWFQDYAKMNKTTLDGMMLSSIGFRLKCWVAQQYAYEQVADKHGVRYIRIPKVAQTDDGYLKTELARDHTHGNYDYGKIMLAHVEMELLA